MQQRFAKYLFAALLLGTCLEQAYAVGPGLYLGLMFGPSTNDGSTEQVQLAGTGAGTVPANPKSTQFGSRVFLGYNINQYVAFEGGLTYFSKIKYVPENNDTVTTCGGADVRIRDFDLLAKGIVPLANTGFDFFGKAGVAITYTSTSGALNPAPLQSCGESTNDVGYRATGTIGISYDLTQSWVVDLSANRIMVGGQVGSVTFYAFGFSYHFTDRYCGQFLCDE